LTLAGFAVGLGTGVVIMRYAMTLVTDACRADAEAERLLAD